MKKIIITAATAPEIEPLYRFLQANYHIISPNNFQNETYDIDVVLSGVGMMNTAFTLAKNFTQHGYDAAIQAGIAGSFDTQLALGSLVGVASEQYGDLGAEDNDTFIDIMEMGFIENNSFPYSEGKLINHNPYHFGVKLNMVSSMSVNTVSGQSDTIDKRQKKNACSIESMEGIAFHYACLQFQIPFLQIRAISNYVTPRNKNMWQIKLAIEHLNQYLIESLNSKNIQL
ncbi:MAG: futalosine hydrolase [Phycisphaerales bacterium]|nr:futalosine hydrolase [Phycisphaerales bacterium]